jgi:AmmeMemoRadiSam system protein B
MKRRPSVAGTFYPGGETELRETLSRMTDPGKPREKAVAVIVPHAGYEYSGPVAGAVLSSVAVPEVALVLGPAHREIGPLFALQAGGSWLTPLGELPIDEELARAILDRCPLVEDDASSHRGEHSIEVELPFLQFFRRDLRFVPLLVSSEAGYDDLEALGEGLARSVREHPREVLAVSSTDMSHYVSQKTAQLKDGRAIQEILALNPRGLHDTVEREAISMCGFRPTTAALVMAKELGATRAELIDYRTSGDRTGDYIQVVGYAGIRILLDPET